MRKRARFQLEHPQMHILSVSHKTLLYEITSIEMYSVTIILIVISVDWGNNSDLHKILHGLLASFFFTNPRFSQGVELLERGVITT